MKNPVIQTKIEFNASLANAKQNANAIITIIQKNDLKNNGKKCPLSMNLLNIINS